MRNYLWKEKLPVLYGAAILERENGAVWDLESSLIPTTQSHGEGPVGGRWDALRSDE